MHSGIGVDKNTLGRESLRAMTGDRVSVIEVPMSSGVEFEGGRVGPSAVREQRTSRYMSPAAAVTPLALK